MNKKKKIVVLIVSVLLLLISINFYIENLRVETKLFCTTIQEGVVTKGINFKSVVELANKNGFTIDPTYKNNTKVLIFKFYSHPGICIGDYKDGLLYNVKYIYHT